MTAPASLLDTLRAVVGRRHVLTGRRARSYTHGYRSGRGSALAVVRPGTLVEQWRVLQACVGHGAVVIAQAANTGLTGGSTPTEEGYDRDVVVVSLTRIAGLHLLDGGRQVVCLPGTTLMQLEDALAPIGREPHSLIGSTCIGASVIGGICNGSGGALVRRGPAYTELALFARIGADRSLTLVNDLGIALPQSAEGALEAVEAGRFGAGDIIDDPHRAASDSDYQSIIRDIAATTPARYNSNAARLRGIAGCAGKLMVFAVRLDTFARPDDVGTFYIGTDRADNLTAIRRHLLSCDRLPILAEYVHRDAFALADTHGRGLFWALRVLGRRGFIVAANLEKRFARVRAMARPFTHLLPDPRPRRIRAIGERYEHQLILQLEGSDGDRLAADLPAVAADSAMLRCTPAEATAALRHRFAVAAAAVAYRDSRADALAGVLSLDVALRRNDPDWAAPLPAALARQIDRQVLYGHFLCHVFHRDYAIKRGVDVAEVKRQLLSLLDAAGAEHPAEHHVGHEYRARPALETFLRGIDPTNAMNPGIGKTSRRANWS